MSVAEGVPDVGPDDPPFPENEGPSRDFPCVTAPTPLACVCGNPSSMHFVSVRHIPSGDKRHLLMYHAPLQLCSVCSWKLRDAVSAAVDTFLKNSVVQPAGVVDVATVYGNAIPGVPLKVPRNKDILVRNILWCESLIWALGEGVIDTKQMERILHIFNEHRPDN